MAFEAKNLLIRRLVDYHFSHLFIFIQASVIVFIFPPTSSLPLFSFRLIVHNIAFFNNGNGIGVINDKVCTGFLNTGFCKEWDQISHGRLAIIDITTFLAQRFKVVNCTFAMRLALVITRLLPVQARITVYNIIFFVEVI